MSGAWYDAIVVGGGPAGATVARGIASAGFRVTILERDRRVGHPVQCSGLVTDRTLVAAGLDPRMALNTLSGAAIHAPSGARYEIGGDRIHAYVLNRAEFDVEVMTQALDVGSDLQIGTRVTAIERIPGGVEVTSERDGKPVTFRGRIVIGADGPRSLVADFLGLPPPVEVLRARGADAMLPRRPPIDQVQIFTGERYAPGFFAWVIPLGGDRYRIGWGSSRTGRGANHLAALLADYPEIFDGIEVLTQTGGLIPLGPRPRTAGDAGIVVGDAAGQAKATSGGGLYTGLTCAAHCARVAIDALTAGDTTAARLSAYDRAWRTDIGGELTRAAVLRRAYRNLTDPELEWGLRLLRVPGIRRLVNHYGDIDYPSRLAAPALRAAPMLRTLLGDKAGLVELLHPGTGVPARLAGD